MRWVRHQEHLSQLCFICSLPTAQTSCPENTDVCDLGSSFQVAAPETFPTSFIDGNFEPHTYLLPEYCGLPLHLPEPCLPCPQHSFTGPQSLAGSLRRGLQVRTSLLLCVIEMRNCPENPEDGHLTAGHSLQYCPSVGDVSGQAPS